MGPKANPHTRGDTATLENLDCIASGLTFAVNGNETAPGLVGVTPFHMGNAVATCYNLSAGLRLQLGSNDKNTANKYHPQRVVSACWLPRTPYTKELHKIKQKSKLQPICSAEGVQPN